MDGFGKKTGKSIRRELTAAQRHARWKRAFFNSAEFKAGKESGEPNYDPGLPNRQYAPSRWEKQNVKARRSFERDLTKACIRLDKKLGDDRNPRASWWIFLNEMRSETTFMEVAKKARTKGRARTIPSFIAKLILVGFRIHSSTNDKYKGHSLMREFFAKNGEFYKKVVRLYGIKNTIALTTSLCGKDSDKTLEKWVKNFRDRADENFTLPDDDHRKSAKERSRKGRHKDRRQPTAQEISDANRTAKVDALVESMARRILGTQRK